MEKDVIKENKTDNIIKDNINNKKRNPLKEAFPLTIPVLIGYGFLGMGFGILMAKAGYNVLATGLYSLVMLSGALQYAFVGWISADTSLGLIFLLALLINFRYIFYGFSFLKEFKKFKGWKPYMIFLLTDETYSILVSLKQEIDIENKDDRRKMFFVGFLDHIYWIMGSIVGCLIGTLIPYSFEGVEFVMTALFIVILLSGFKGFKNSIPMYIGFVVSLVCLYLVGVDDKNTYLVVSLIIIVIAIVVKNQIEEHIAKKKAKLEVADNE